MIKKLYHHLPSYVIIMQNSKYIKTVFWNVEIFLVLQVMKYQQILEFTEERGYNETVKRKKLNIWLKE